MTEMTTTLAPMDVAGRLPRLRAALAAQDLPALLVTSRANVRYLTGFTGSAGSLLVSADDAMLVTDGRYRTQSAEQVAGAGVDARVEIGLTMAEQRDMFARRRRAPSDASVSRSTRSPGPSSATSRRRSQASSWSRPGLPSRTSAE